MKRYRAKCRECGGKILDPKLDENDPEPIYVVATDEYFCNEECFDKNRKELINETPNNQGVDES